MAHPDDGIYVHSVDLMFVANTQIPDLAKTYGDATKSVDETASSDVTAFTDRVAPHWQGFRDAFQHALAQTQANLQSSSVALVNVVNGYIEEDEDFAEMMAKAEKPKESTWGENYDSIGQDRVYNPKEYPKPLFPDSE